MHFDSLAPWQVNEDCTPELLVALYLRDALGIDDPSGLPRLLGTGLPAIRATDGELAAWWLRWWRTVLDPEQSEGWGVPLELVDHHPTVALPVEGAEIFVEAIRPHLDNAEIWAEVVSALYQERGMRRVQRDGLLWADAVRDREAELGRNTGFFRLRVEVLPLTTAGIWWIGERAIAVDDALRDDADAYRAALKPVIDRLV